jgi:hypothetical protein
MITTKPKNKIRKHHPATHLKVPAGRNKASAKAINSPKI